MRYRSWATVLASALLTLLCGCTTMDQFGGRAIEFNRQVADTQDRTLLLNILRAAHRYPMHFTELSTLTGTSTVTGSGSLSIPFATFRTQTGAAFTGTPGLQVAESPTFNVAVLETQEFYQGMLKSLTTDEIATYVTEGLPPELIFTLAIGDIVYQKEPGAEPVTIVNDFHPLSKSAKEVCPSAAQTQYECFQAVLRALVDQRMTLEQVKSTSNVGALLPSESFGDLKWLNGLDPKAFKFSPVTADDCKLKADVCPEGLAALPAKQQASLGAGETLYRIQKSSSEFRFCFDRKFRGAPDPYPPMGTLVDRIHQSTVGDKLYCQARLTEDDKKTILQSARDADEAAKAAAVKVQKANAEIISVSPGASKAEQAKVDAARLRAEQAAIDLSLAKNLQQLNALSRSSFGFTDSKDPTKPKDLFNVEVHPRSTEGVIYYLGEIARCNLTLDQSSSCGTLPHIRVGYRPGQEDLLFAVSDFKSELGTAAKADPGVTVDWEGKHFRVRIDPSASDRSGQVLRVVTQLLALNRAAKDFPTPTVIPIISH